MPGAANRSARTDRHDGQTEDRQICEAKSDAFDRADDIGIRSAGKKWLVARSFRGQRAWPPAIQHE
jgi:hypothetical protein